MDNYNDILKEKGLKCTSQRLALLEVIDRLNEPSTESEIKNELPEGADRTTLYRTLQTLISAHVIHKINVDSNTVKYAMTGSMPANHIHFYCNACHRVTCLDQSVDINISVPQKYKTEECEILVKGICDKCNQA